MITAVLLWQPYIQPVYIYKVVEKKRVSYTYGIAKFAPRHSYLCAISSGFAVLLWSFYEHTVTLLISQLFRSLAATNQYRRGVSFMISLQHAGQKYADRNSHLTTTWHTFGLTCASNLNKFRREGKMNNREGVLTHAHTIRPGGRQYVCDAATQLLCIMAVCTYQWMSVDGYEHKQQTSRMSRVLVV